MKYPNAQRRFKGTHGITEPFCLHHERNLMRKLMSEIGFQHMSPHKTDDIDILQAMKIYLFESLLSIWFHPKAKSLFAAVSLPLML